MYCQSLDADRSRCSNVAKLGRPASRLHVRTGLPVALRRRGSLDRRNRLQRLVFPGRVERRLLDGVAALVLNRHGRVVDADHAPSAAGDQMGVVDEVLSPLQNPSDPPRAESAHVLSGPRGPIGRMQLPPAILGRCLATLAREYRGRDPQCPLPSVASRHAVSGIAAITAVRKKVSAHVGAREKSHGD